MQYHESIQQRKYAGGKYFNEKVTGFLLKTIRSGLRVDVFPNFLVNIADLC